MTDPFDPRDPETGGVALDPADLAEVAENGPGWQDGRIATIAGLDWAGRKMRETLEAVREADELAQAEIAPLLTRLNAAQKRLDATLAPLQKRASFFESQIRVFAETNRDAILRGLGRGAKSKTLPSGLRVSWRHDPGGYRWDDEMKESERKAALLKWATDRTCEKLPLTRMERVLVFDEVKRGLELMSKDTGERHLAPGVKFVEPGDTLTITTEKDSTP